MDRGAVQALDADTGRLLWTWHAIPSPEEGGWTNSVCAIRIADGTTAWCYQFSCGGHAALDPQGGDTVVAFTLPD